MIILTKVYLVINMDNIIMFLSPEEETYNIPSLVTS